MTVLLHFSYKITRRGRTVTLLNSKSCLGVMIDIKGSTDSVLGESSHRHKGTASHITDLVWLYRSPIPGRNLGGGGGWSCTVY